MANNRPLPLTGSMLPGQLPVRGINARDAATRMQPDDAINLINFFSDDYGITMRNGYQEFAINLPGSMDVPTIMSYYPGGAAQSIALGALPTSVTQFIQIKKPRIPIADISIRGYLFAGTNNGKIYDITSGGTGPWADMGVNGPSDYWSHINFQNAAGNFLLAVNNEGLYAIFGGAGFSAGFSSGFATAAAAFATIGFGNVPGTIGGIDPNLFVDIMVWKHRIWFIEKESTRAWYLPVDQITGEATLFDFGPNFRHGGTLVGLVNWTIDGGEGIDDHLIAISSQGDIVIYKGYDPDSADTDPNAFQLHGIWYVGALPKGRRNVTTYGGDVYVLSIYGISQISKLLAMAEVAANLVEDSGSRIDPYISQLMQDSSQLEGWYIRFLPQDQMMLIGLPQQITGEGSVQLGMKIRQKAWSKILDVPISCMVNHDTLTFGGGVVIGGPVTGAGKVFLLFKNSLDNVPIAGTGGKLIRGRITPAFQSFGSPGLFKVFSMIRPTIYSPVVPSIRLTMLTDYTEGSFFTVPTLPIINASLWDVDFWDNGRWVGYLAPIRKWLGIAGAGFAATVQMDIIGVGGTRIMSIDYWLQQGGAL